MPPSLNKVFLMPGQYHVGDARCRIATLLGSCVSITLWHPSQRIGAMSHFVLCNPNPGSGLNGRYGEDALTLMLAELKSLGVDPKECEAKIFGGGAMFADHDHLHMPDVGRRNGELARRMLLAHGIPIVSESLFGEGHREILFNVKTGDVWVRHVQLPHDSNNRTPVEGVAP